MHLQALPDMRGKFFIILPVLSRKYQLLDLVPSRRKVMQIGGVKEKTIAARRAGLTILIFPEGNRKDFEELPDYLKDGIDVHYARDYPDVYRVAFNQ